MWHRLLPAAVVSFALAACGGGSSGSSGPVVTDPPNLPPPTTDGLRVIYTHTAAIQDWEWAVDWFVEDLGTLSGPFDSAGSGVVGLGDPMGATVHVSRRIGAFTITYMGVPVAPIDYYTGDNDITQTSANVTVNVANTMPGEELLLFYPFVNWWSVDADPYSLTQTVAGVDLIDDNGRATVFVSYRQSVADEPGSLYDFRADLDPSAVSGVDFDVTTMRRRTQSIQWQSPQILTGNGRPSLWAKRNGVYLLVGDSTDGASTSGFIGTPDAFAADEWYLLSGLTARPDIFRRIDPFDPDPSVMEPMPGAIDDTSIAYDSATGVLSVLAPGMTADIDFGHVLLGSTTSPWDVYFPVSALTITGDMVTLQLPLLPEHADLPEFQTVTIQFFRLDDGGSAVDLYRSLWDRRSNPTPSYAMQSAFESL